MHCTSCKTVILPAFKHAVATNQCPACGGQIMDEESLALIDDVRQTISSEATVREETAQKLATALVLKYKMILPEESIATSDDRKPKVVKHKIAKPSIAQQVMEESQDVVRVSELVDDGVSEGERERIMEEAVRKRYAMVDGIQDSGSSFPSDDPSYDGSTESIFSEGSKNPLLERERLARLAKQKQAMEGGGSGGFRRGC